MGVVVVTGIDGAQQRAVARAFGEAGWTVRGTRRSAAGDRTARADLATGEGLREAFAGAEAVVFTLPQDHRPGAMRRMAETVVRTAAEAGVGRLVVNLAGRATGGAEVFRTLREVADIALGGRVPAAVLEPTVYMDNLRAPFALPALLQGTFAYPAPEDAPIAWLSHRSLAEAAVAAVTAPVAGRRLCIGGPEALTGPEVAQALSAAVGREVTYLRLPLPAFAEGLNAAFGPPAGDRIAELYADLAVHPDAMADGADTLAELGVAPETLAAFLARHDWAQAA